MNKVAKLAMVILISVLTACGGGGGGGGGGGSGSGSGSGGSNSSDNELRNITAPIYTESLNAVEDLTPQVANLCGSRTPLSLKFADLDGDGKPELIIVAACDLDALGRSDLLGTPYNGPVVNSMFIYKMNAANKYVEATRLITGIDQIVLEGSNNFFQFADFNLDGKIDILLAPFKEDGRQPVVYSDGTSNWDTHLQVLISTNNGYRLDAVGGYTAYHHDASIISDGKGLPEIVSAGYRYAYINGVWVENISQASPNGYGVIEFNQSGINYVAVQNNRGPSLDSRFGFDIKTRTAGDNWNIVSQYTIGTLDAVSVLSSGQQQNFTHMRMGGVDYLAPAMTEMCTLVDGGGKTRINILYSAIPLKQTANLSALVYGADFTWQDMVFGVLSYELNNGQVSRSIEPVIFEVNPIVTDAIRCQDIDGDGVKDLVVPTYSASYQTTQAFPRMLITTNTGWKSISPSKFGGIPNFDWYGVSFESFDIYGDGSLSLAYFANLGTSRLSNYSGPIGIRIFRNTNKRALNN